MATIATRDAQRKMHRALLFLLLASPPSATPAWPERAGIPDRSKEAWRFTEHTATGVGPFARTLAASAVIGGDFYVVGGHDGNTVYTDAFRLTLDPSLHWTKLKVVRQENASLKKRAMQAHWSVDRSIFIHGGWDNSNLSTIFSDILEYNVDSQRLTTLQTTGKGPGPICRHAAAVMHTDAGRSVFVNGGWDGKEWLDSTWRLDLDASVDGRPLMPVWTVLRTEGFTPWKRSHHCLMAGPRAPHLLLFGGGDGDQDFQDLYTLDVTTGYWNAISNTTGVNKPRIQGGCGLLQLPASDANGHALIAYGGIGGKEGTKHHTVEVLPLGLPGAKGGWAWAELRLSGAWPDGRNGHSFHIVNSSCMLIFGGAAGFGDDRGNTNALLLVRPNRLVPAHELPRDGAGGWSGGGDDDEDDDGPQLLSLDDDRDGGDGGDAPLSREELQTKTVSELDEIVRTKTVTRRVQPGGPKKKKKRKGVRPDAPRVSVRATKDEV